MAKITGRVFDEQTGKLLEARVQVINSGGGFSYPAGAILQAGTVMPFFYSTGRFEVDVQCGTTRILVERGTEYAPWIRNIAVPARGTIVSGRHAHAGPVSAFPRHFRESPKPCDLLRDDREPPLEPGAPLGGGRIAA